MNMSLEWHAVSSVVGPVARFRGANLILERGTVNVLLEPSVLNA